MSFPIQPPISSGFFHDFPKIFPGFFYVFPIFSYDFPIFSYDFPISDLDFPISDLYFLGGLRHWTWSKLPRTALKRVPWKVFKGSVTFRLGPWALCETNTLRSGKTSPALVNGYGSIPINTIFRGMNIHLPAILMWTTGVLLVLTHCQMGVSENSVPLNPMVLLIMIPIKWL